MLRLLLVCAALLPSILGDPVGSGRVAENLVLHSEDLVEAGWLREGVTVVPCAVGEPIPPAIARAWLLQEESREGLHRLARATESETGAVHTLSFFAKAAGRSLVCTQVTNSTDLSATWDLERGVVVSVGRGVRCSGIVPLGSGWHRCHVSGLLGNRVIQVAPAVVPDSLPGSAVRAGDPGKGILLGGVQLNRGSDPSEYAATTSAAVRIEWAPAAAPPADAVPREPPAPGAPGTQAVR